MTFLRLRVVGNPSETVIRAQVAEHLDRLLQSQPDDIPTYADEVRRFWEKLARGARPSDDA